MSELHKFGWSPKHLRRPEAQPVPILLRPYDNLKYPHEKQHNYKWAVLLQDDITIEPNVSKIITLQFGVTIALSAVIISLPQNLKLQRITLLNEIVIVVTLHNSSSSLVKLKVGEILCYLVYFNL